MQLREAGPGQAAAHMQAVAVLGHDVLDQACLLQLGDGHVREGGPGTAQVLHPATSMELMWGGTGESSAKK